MWYLYITQSKLYMHVRAGGCSPFKYQTRTSRRHHCQKRACSTNHTRIIFKNGISQGNYMVTKSPVQWYPRIFKSILNSSLTYIKCLDYLHFQASFSPVFFLLQVQGLSCDFCPEKRVCLGFIEGTFSNLSLQGRHFRGGKDREEESIREDRDKESQREGQGARGREREKRSRKEEIRSIRLPDKLNQSINPRPFITPKMYILYTTSSEWEKWSSSIDYNNTCQQKVDHILYLSSMYTDFIGGLIRANMSEPGLDMKYVRHVWICYSTFIPKPRKPAFIWDW